MGWDYWIGLLDGFFHLNVGSVVVRSSQGFCFLQNHGVCCGAFLAGTFFLLFVSPCSVVQLPRRGVFFLLLRLFLKKCNIRSTKIISGPDF